jgi:hypothetical protein
MSALPEARESLTYWETRLQYLPKRALRRRREARAMAARWRSRVEEAERAQYGDGLLGAAFMFYVERRLPARTRRSAEQMVRVGKGAAVAVAATAVALSVLACVAVIALLAAIF